MIEHLRTVSSHVTGDVRLYEGARVHVLLFAVIATDNKKLNHVELAELIGTYVSAGNARHLLQQRFEQT